MLPSHVAHYIWDSKTAFFHGGHALFNLDSKQKTKQKIFSHGPALPVFDKNLPLGHPDHMHSLSLSLGMCVLLCVSLFLLYSLILSAAPPGLSVNMLLSVGTLTRANPYPWNVILGFGDKPLACEIFLASHYGKTALQVNSVLPPLPYQMNTANLSFFYIFYSTIL
jgi:hypothetical protein